MKQRKPMSTWFLLFVVNGFVLITGFVIFLAISLKSLKDTALLQTEHNLKSFTYSLEKMIPRPTESNSIIDIDSFIKSLTISDPSYRITLIKEDGTVFADSVSVPKNMENHLSREEIKSALIGNEGKSLHTSSVNGKTLMYFAIPSEYNGEKIVLRLSMPVDETVFFSTSTKSSLIAVSIILLAAVIVASFLISLQIIRPVYEINKATEQYKIGNFNYHVYISSPREMADLGDSFNIMSDTITKNIASMKQLEKVRRDFVANVSHELKTPVTSIKGFTETMLDGALEDKDTAKHFLSIIDTQCSRLMNIIDDLLTLSRLENNGETPDMQTTNIVSLIDDVIENFRTSAEEKNIQLDYHASKKQINVSVNKGLIEQAIGNLIDNAIKYCSSGCHILCLLDTEPIKKITSDNKIAINNCIKIIVEDDGPGIEDKYKERVFERFYRVDKGRSREAGGTGLGLSIVRHILSLHHGTVCVKNRSDNKTGSRFEVIIPLKLN